MKQLLLAVLVASTLIQPYAIAGTSYQSSLLNSPVNRLAPQSYTANQGLSSPVIWNDRRQSQSLNTQGYRLYKQGKFDQALPFFYRATQADENYMFGQYNFACTASILLNSFDCRYYDENLLNMANPDKIISALQKTLELKPERITKIQNDPDLDLVRKSYQYYHDVLGYSDTNDEHLMIMLQNIDWQAAGMRYYHVEPTARLLFGQHGEVRLVKSTLIEGNIPDNSPPWTHSYTSGSYRVHNGTVTLTFEDGKKIRGRIKNGMLVFDRSGNSYPLPAYHYPNVWPTPCDNA